MSIINLLITARSFLMGFPYRFPGALQITVLWLLLVACISENVKSATIPVPTVQPTEQSTNIDVENLVAGDSLTYKGVTPGISHKRDVIEQWGEPNVIRAFENYESLHYFYGFTKKYVLIQNDVVQAITWTSRQDVLERNGQEAQLEDLIALLGEPEIITPPFGLPTQVFPDYGIAVADYAVFIQSYQFFIPTSFQDYQNLWGELPLSHDPFPLAPSVEAAGIQPGITAREEVAALLGNPDRINFEDENAPWWYTAEPDLWGRLFVVFTAHDLVDSLYIIEVKKKVTLGEIVNTYGLPDTLQLIPGFEGMKYETLALVYLERGLRIATTCVLPSCEIVKQESLVGQKWYFPAKTMEEYQAIFPESVFLEWHGFDE